MANYSPNDEPFPGSAADFYEKNQKLLEALSECAQNKADLKALITELADGIKVLGVELNYNFQSMPQWDSLLQRAREATK